MNVVMTRWFEEIEEGKMQSVAGDGERGKGYVKIAF
jgi:hypothetical protein